MADFDAFLKVETIPGESQDSKHKGEIDLISWSWGMENKGTMATGGGGGAGKVSMKDLVVQKYVDKASPKLYIACSTGEHIKQAILYVRKAGGEQQEYLKITFSDLLISSVSALGTRGETPLIVEEVGINFTKFEAEYKPQKADGTLDAGIKAGYDLKQQMKV